MCNGVRNVTQMVGLDVSLYHKFIVLPLEIFSETFGQWTKIWSIDLDIEPFLSYFHSNGRKSKKVSSQKVLDLSKCTIEKRSNIPG